MIMEFLERLEMGDFSGLCAAGSRFGRFLEGWRGILLSLWEVVGVIL
jgi:hypothetical protein